MWDLILTDPVAWGSILGIGVVVAICGYYLYLFMHNVNENL
jgi:drug/metabolite transporter (DMT)-like permease